MKIICPTLTCERSAEICARGSFLQ